MVTAASDTLAQRSIDAQPALQVAHNSPILESLDNLPPQLNVRNLNAVPSHDNPSVYAKQPTHLRSYLSLQDAQTKRVLPRPEAIDIANSYDVDPDLKRVKIDAKPVDSSFLTTVLTMMFFVVFAFVIVALLEVYLQNKGMKTVWFNLAFACLLCVLWVVALNVLSRRPDHQSALGLGLNLIIAAVPFTILIFTKSLYNIGSNFKLLGSNMQDSDKKQFES